MVWTRKESGYLMEPIGVKDDLRRGVSNVKTAKKVFFQGDGSLDAFYSRILEKIYVFWTPKESRYIMEPIGVKDDLRRGVKNISSGQKGKYQRRQDYFFQDNVRYSKCSESGYLMEPIGVKKDLRKGVRNVQN